MKDKQSSSKEGSQGGQNKERGIRPEEKKQSGNTGGGRQGKESGSGGTGKGQ